MQKKNGELDSKYINESSVSVIIQKFNEWKNTNLQGRFHYAKSETPVTSTALSHADGTPRDTISQGRIGTKISPEHLVTSIFMMLLLMIHR